MNYLQIDKASIENGLGVRVVLWVSGCTVSCPGCHTPWTHDFFRGRPFNEDAKEKIFEHLDKPWIKGITLSGGHPLEVQNMLDVYNLLTEIRERYPDKDVWLYTGLELTYEQFTYPDDASIMSRILRLCDVIVDGPFVMSQRNITIAFRGSENQRLIDVKRTLEAGKIVTLKLEDE